MVHLADRVNLIIGCAPLQQKEVRVLNNWKKCVYWIIEREREGERPADCKIAISNPIRSIEANMEMLVYEEKMAIVICNASHH